MKYTNKLVEFLNGANTIKITCNKDFISYASMCKKVGLKPIFTDYWELVHIAQLNHCLIGLGTVLVEYQPYGGFTMGYKTIEESKKWYDKEPWTIKEILESLK